MQCFVYHQIMNVESVDARVSKIAAAIAEPARTRMLYCLLDGHARTSTELAVIAGVTPATASVHLARLKEQQLVKVHAQGRHRYYSLEDFGVADVLENLSVLAGGARAQFVPSTPSHLTAARTCYDHMAGRVAVTLHDRLIKMGWLRATPDAAYDLTAKGAAELATLGIDVAATRATRRRFAYPCLDWSERQPHLGGALGAALLKVAMRRQVMRRDLDSRALKVTRQGWRELQGRFDIAF
jgi:DNA-binding transcriptional ArsR family regulator